MSEYKSNRQIMTQNEINLYIQLKNYIILNKLNYDVFPQVRLENIIQTDKYKNRNRIKSKCIDFTVVSKGDYKTIFCIELDDTTHNKQDRIERDKFINQIFTETNIKLFRIIKIKTNYQEEIEYFFKRIKQLHIK